ncbi:hypothetical protein [Lactococcus allomyrinae]|uniref:Uncharacterized protein n=1 Tax=Lactococcus allomyrinae TaxID=2419773 RepID=A0A387BA38_9LACT|nr:hypothetical protein [Lactococcus allomyrinae]AYG00593.1 hypothetical protein D7I46_05490 [Lactococcus allomyrinae]
MESEGEKSFFKHLFRPKSSLIESEITDSESDIKFLEAEKYKKEIQELEEKLRISEKGYKIKYQLLIRCEKELEKSKIDCENLSKKLAQIEEAKDSSKNLSNEQELKKTKDNIINQFSKKIEQEKEEIKQQKENIEKLEKKLQKEEEKNKQLFEKNQKEVGKREEIEREFLHAKTQFSELIINIREKYPTEEILNEKIKNAEEQALLIRKNAEKEGTDIVKKAQQRVENMLSEKQNELDNLASKIEDYTLKLESCIQMIDAVPSQYLA